MRLQYWNNTKFACWLRGTPKPLAATWEDWRKWHKQAKVAHPIRYWFAEDFLSSLQNFIYWPTDKLNDIRFYIINRWVTKSHALTSSPTHIKPGNWCDLSNRFLPCLFSELVDFVEIEKASRSMWDEEIAKEYPVSWYHKLFRIPVRCPGAGLKYLEWETTLVYEKDMCNPTEVGKPTPQAVAAKEIIELYKWWTQVYPNRVDPHVASGWSDYCDKKREADDDDMSFLSSNRTPEDEELVKDILEKSSQLEKERDTEDEEMMIRLIRIRNQLWT